MAAKTITLGKADEADVELELFGKRYALAKPTRKAVRQIAALQAQVRELGLAEVDEAAEGLDADKIEAQARLCADGVEAMTAKSDGLADLLMAEWDKDELSFPDLMDLFGDVAQAFQGATEAEGND